MAIDSAERTEPRSRRAILAGAIGGLAGLIGSRFANPDRTSAAAGGPVIMGAANDAGTTSTSVATASSGTALLVTQNGAGTALRGSAVGAGSIAGFFTANNGTGISGVTGSGGSYGVFAQNNGAAGSAGALRASGGNNDGVVATTSNSGALAVYAANSSSVGSGILGQSLGTTGSFGAGVTGITKGEYGSGVVGSAESVTGFAIQPAYGVAGYAFSPYGYGIFGSTSQGTGYGVYSAGNAHVEGDLSVSGDVNAVGNVNKAGGTFKIDHPLDPANKFLYHSFVESPDMKNVYDGVATLDAKGEATVTLPDWFERLNKDFRYQLTSLGQTTRVLYVKSKVKGNAFSIGGGSAGQEVSWQITGTRQDAWANAHRVVVEETKPKGQKGKYLHPREQAQPASKGIGYAQQQALKAATSKAKVSSR